MLGLVLGIIALRDSLSSFCLLLLVAFCLLVLFCHFQVGQGHRDTGVALGEKWTC